MGRLIDADVLREEIYSWGMNDYEPSDFTDAIDDAPTVEAIPKDQYESRLKADIVAMLTDIQLEVEEYDVIGNHSTGSYEADLYNGAYSDGMARASSIIQQKVDALKAESEE